MVGPRGWIMGGPSSAWGAETDPGTQQPSGWLEVGGVRETTGWERMGLWAQRKLQIHG